MISMLAWILFVAIGVFGQVEEELPVCIIGGGITGLTLAHQFKENQVPYIVLEKETKPGGKAVTYRDEYNDYQLDMGPLLFSKNSTNSLKLFRQLGFGYTPRAHGNFTAFILGTNITKKCPRPDIIKAQERYFTIRKNIKLRPGNLNANPDLNVSLGAWLVQHKLHELIAPSQIMVSASGYGSVFETPALYGLRILDEHGYLHDPLYTVTDGLDKVFQKYAEGLEVRLGRQVMRIYTRGQISTEAAVLYKAPKGLKIKECSKIITAFPPLHDTLSKLMDHTANPLLDLLKQVNVNKFVTFAVDNAKLKDLTYFPVMDFDGPRMLPGDGRITGLVRQKNIYSCYIWLNGPSSTPASPTEFIDMQRQLRDDIDALTDTSFRTRIPAFRNWEYFPHVNTQSLNDGFYKQLDSLQGYQGLYIAGPLLSFETIHNSIDAAYFMFDHYLHPVQNHINHYKYR